MKKDTFTPVAMRVLKTVVCSNPHSGVQLVTDINRSTDEDVTALDIEYLIGPMVEALGYELVNWNPGNKQPGIRIRGAVTEQELLNRARLVAFTLGVEG